MNRAPRIFVSLCALVTLAGCASTPATEQAQVINPRQPAYLSMSSGDQLGSVFIQNRMYIARKNGENSAYASVVPRSEYDDGE